MLYELIIIGAGPAGITAAVYAARKKIDFLLISEDIGGQAAWSGEVENYTGYQFITGPELAVKFEEHMRKYRISMREPESARDVRLKGSDIIVETDRALYESRSVIIASGKKSRELGVPGEKEFKNKGLAYCATCDGPLFSGKDVVVIGGGNSALDAALQLIKIAGRIYIINNTSSLGGDKVMRDKVISSGIVKVFNNSKVTAITGDKMVSGVKIETEGNELTLDARGVFVEIGLVPNSKFIKIVNKNSNGEIVINNRNETNIPGIFAAGDVTDIPGKQIIIAAGEGSKATLSVFEYLSRKT